MLIQIISSVAFALGAWLPSKKYVQGYVDVIDENGIVWGWAKSKQSNDSPIMVQFFVDGDFKNGKVAGTVTANENREDVGLFGYHFSLPREYFDGQEHNLFVYGIGTKGLEELTGSPMKFKFSTYRFGVQSLDGDPWRPIPNSTITVTGPAGYNETQTSDQNGIYVFVVPKGNYHVKIVADGFLDTEADVFVDHDFIYNEDPPGSFFEVNMPRRHFDPKLVSEEKLRYFRGDFGGIYIPEIAPQCPQDPVTGIRCENARGLANGAFFTAVYGNYTKEQREAIRRAYTTGIGVDGRPRNYTHFPLNVNCDPTPGYHGLFPAIPCDTINELLHELWDHSPTIIPVCFLTGGLPFPPDISRLDKSLCRIVVPMWEMDGPFVGNPIEESLAFVWARQQFPDALIYGHWTSYQSGPMDPGAGWWQWAAREGRFPLDSITGWPKNGLTQANFPNPHLTGILMQTQTWDGMEGNIGRYREMLSRLGGGLNGWPGGVDVVLFESDIYAKFWWAKSEAEGIRDNNQIAQYMNTPLCDAGRCGKLSGFCSGSTIDKQ